MAPLQGSSARRSLVLLTLLAACGGPGTGDGRDPYAKVPIAKLTPAEVVTVGLPKGYRLGDPLPPPHEKDGDISFRTRRDPAPGIFYVTARGRTPHAAVVQMVTPVEHQVAATAWATAAGVRLGDPVALMLVPETRNWARLSQSHISPLRFPALLIATDHPSLHLVVYGDKVDSVVWVKDLAALTLIEGEPLADALARADAALAATDLDAIQKYVGNLEGAARSELAGADFKARVAERRRAREERMQVHDAPLLDELAQHYATLRAAWTAASPRDRLALWGKDVPAMTALQKRLRGGAWPGAGSLRTLLEETAGAAAPKGEPTDARGTFWTWLGQNLGAQPERIAQLGEAAHVLDFATTYVAAAQAYANLTSGKERVGRDHIPVLRGGVAKAVLAEAEGHRVRGRALADRYVQGVWRRLLLQRIATGAFPTEDPAAVAIIAARLHDFERTQGTEARLSWLERQQSSWAKNDPAHSNARTLLQQLRKEECKALLAQGEAAAAGGYVATAAVAFLQSAVVQRAAWSEPTSLASALGATPANAEDHLRALAALAPILRVVLPPLHGTTSQGQRLAELLHERKAATWPVVSALTLVCKPGDMPPAPPTDDGVSAEGARYAWLRTKDGAAELSVQNRPQLAGIDSLYWDRMSGLSEATIKENAWLRGEGEWITKEKEALDAERPGVEAEATRLEAMAAQMQARREKLDAYNGSAVDDFNRDAANGRKQIEAARKRQDAHGARVKALNARVTPFNERVANNNERRMRERSAGALKVDAMLAAALEAFVTAQMAAWEQETRARLPAGPELETEIGYARWFFGQGGRAPVRWHSLATPAGAKLRMAAIERNITARRTHAEVAAEVMAWWRAAAEAKTPADEREKFFRRWAVDFAKYRDLSLLQAVVKSVKGLSGAERKRLETWMTEAAAGRK